MWGLLAAIGIVGSLAALAATEKSDDPILRPAVERIRLAKILVASKRRRLTKRELDDGLVLARRLEERDLERRFAREIQKRQGRL